MPRKRHTSPKSGYIVHDPCPFRPTGAQAKRVLLAMSGPKLRPSNFCESAEWRITLS